MRSLVYKILSSVIVIKSMSADVCNHKAAVTTDSHQDTFYIQKLKFISVSSAISSSPLIRLITNATRLGIL